MKLVYSYNQGSTLPRREFVVNTLETTRFETTAQQYEVTAPDMFQAQRLVRLVTERDETLVSYWTVSVREVTRNYLGQVVVRSLMEEGVSAWT